MKRWMLAASLLALTSTAGFADGLFWVVGNRATGQCPIVTSNPVITGDIWFADGPYKSRDDARLARSTISACPAPDPEEDPKQEAEQKQGD